MVDGGRALALVGAVVVLASLGVLYVASPWHVTSILATEDAADWPTDDVADATADVRDPVSFSNLSSAEQTAVDRAVRSPDDRYADRGVSANGSTFTYRNDVTNLYAVQRQETVYLVSVYQDVDYAPLGLGILGGLAGGVFLVGGIYVATRD